MILMMTSTKWGNLYRHRYYLDGRRISEREGNELARRAIETVALPANKANFPGGYRCAWRVQ